MEPSEARSGLIEPLVGAAALALQRPVRLVLTRSEDSAATNPAPGCMIDLKVGADTGRNVCAPSTLGS